jgi:hypothetical protein
MRSEIKAAFARGGDELADLDAYRRRQADGD